MCCPKTGSISPLLTWYKARGSSTLVAGITLMTPKAFEHGPSGHKRLWQFYDSEKVLCPWGPHKALQDTCPPCRWHAELETQPAVSASLNISSIASIHTLNFSGGALSLISSSSHSSHKAGRHSVPTLWSCDVWDETDLLTEADMPHRHGLQDTASNKRKCGPRAYDGYYPTPPLGLILQWYRVGNSGS